MSVPIFKICPYCAEQINAAAKVCPRCRQWLSIYSLRNPAAFMGVFCLCILVFWVGTQMQLQKLFNSGLDFSPYRDGIAVVESRMNIKDAGKDSSVYVVALITNRTEITWKEVQLEVRFFSKTGNLIDARTSWANTPIFPHGDSAVNIKVLPGRPLSDYESYKIFVRYARGVHAHF